MRNNLLAVVPAALVLIGAATMAACSDSSTSPASDQSDVIASLADQYGAQMDTNFGVEGGARSDAAAPAPAGLPAIVLADTATLPAFWGRLRIIPGGPKPILNRNIVIQGDTARVTQTISFQGLFLVDTTKDTVFNPTSKTLDEGMTQSAVLVRDASKLHHWRAVSLTLQNWLPTSVAARTVAITQITVKVNDSLRITADNPDSLYTVGRMLHLHVGDTVSVTASVTNSDATYSPTTFVFLHVHHAFSDLSWHRMPMKNNGDGTFSRTWVVSRVGIDRFIVDGINAATLELGTANNYDANEWGIPYRID
ncbi:MAG TPA: hypothetical protein VEV39_11460 [Gemmatimonadales bacterium]|nr:hypothetical protein [Gemmatimonadales bacterium]